jgi:fluoroacetyl-CoA thioesterase
VKPTLQPGLTGHLEYRVPAERTVPHLLPEAGEFQGMPRVLATGYLIGLVEWACMRALRGHEPVAARPRNSGCLHEPGDVAVRVPH